MASWSNSPTPSPLQATAVSDCPQCGSVCVGGLLLPCGHLTCRKCLRDHHGSQLTCHTCQHRLPLPKDQGSADFTSLVQRLGVDPVMALMVNEQLRGQGRQACLVCENREATTLCQDCNEFYCHSCARMHGRQRATIDHVMQPLPQALHNVFSADYAVPKPRTHSASSCDSMDIISNPMDQPKSRGQSRGSTRWKQWVRREVGMLQAVLSEQDALVMGLNDVLTVAEKRQTLLQCYAKSLSLFDVTPQDDDNIFNVTVTHDDVSMQVKLDSLQQRLRDVIVGPHDASFTSDVRQLIKQLDDVLSNQGTWSTSAQSSTTQSVGLLQSTASSKASVTSPSLSSSPFATPTVNMSTPTSSAATPTCTAQKTTLNMSTPVCSATTPTSTASTLTSNASKTTNIISVNPAPSTLVATTIISNTAIVMPANTAATPTKVSFSSGAPTANTVTTVATPTAATINAFTTISSAASPTNNAVTPTDTTNVTVTPIATTDNATPTTSTFTAISSSAKPTTITAFNSAITALTDISAVTATVPASTVIANTSTPISSVSTPTNTLDTKQKSTKNSITYSNTTAQPTVKQATPMSTTVTNPSMSSTIDRATSNSNKLGMATDTTTTTKDKPTLANTTATNKLGAKAANTTTASPVCATTPTCTPSVDPMTARPRRAFSVRPVCAGDSRKPDITSIISTRDGQRLVMTDSNNDKMKVVDLHHPHKVFAALTVIEKPHCLALLPDDLVTLTTYSPVIYFMEITDTVTVTSRIKTDVTYQGVGGLSDGRLIVSCGRVHNNGVARVDIITCDGNVVTTITDTNTLTRLDYPWFLSVVESHVLLSEWFSNAVYKVDIGSGHLVDTFTHPGMRSPHQLTSDGSGNVYIASKGGRCVLVRSAGGQWRKLLKASQQSDKGCGCPRGVCLTSDGRLVVAWCKGSDNVVIAYDLSSTLVATTIVNKSVVMPVNTATTPTTPPLTTAAATVNALTTIRDGAASTKHRASSTRNTTTTTRVRAMAANTTTLSAVWATTSTPSVDPMTTSKQKVAGTNPSRAKSCVVFSLSILTVMLFWWFSAYC